LRHSQPKNLSLGERMYKENVGIEKNVGGEDV
jgi:hypothetical protein